MIGRTLSAIALTLMLVACGEGGSNASPADNQATSLVTTIKGTLSDAVSAVDTAKDEATATAAVPKITDALTRFKELKSQFDGVKDASMSVKTTGSANILASVTELGSKISSLKAQNPKVYDIIVTAVKKLGVPGLDSLL